MHAVRRVGNGFFDMKFCGKQISLQMRVVSSALLVRSVQMMDTRVAQGGGRVAEVAAW